jgi:diaminopimelate decarboxylase
MKISGLTADKGLTKFSGVSISSLTKKHGTPLMVFSEQRLIDNYNAFKKSFENSYDNVAIHYSIKTNWEIQILSTLKELGAKGEAASGIEILLAQKAGFKASELIVDGPTWTNEEIELYIKKGVKTLNVDSMDQMELVNKIAGRLKKKVRVTFRINPEMNMSILKSFVESYISKFGIPLSKAVETYEKILKFKNVIPVGVSTHIGSMITDPGYYEKAIVKLCNLCGELRSQLNIDIEEINLGGGYGLQSLNYFSAQNIILEKAGISAYKKAASIEEFGQRIGKQFKTSLQKNNLGNVQLVLEPGRFLVSDSGIMLTSVISKKDDWIFINGGINLIPESIFFIRRGFVIEGMAGKKATVKFNIAGPTLNTADVLATNQSLPNVNVGDTVIVLDSGAYSLTRSNQFTILRPTCLYIKANGSIKYLRKKEVPNEISSKMLH